MADITIRYDGPEVDEVITVGTTCLEDLGGELSLVCYGKLSTSAAPYLNATIHAVYPGHRAVSWFVNSRWCPMWLEDWIDRRWYVRVFVVEASGCSEERPPHPTPAGGIGGGGGRG